MKINGTGQPPTPGVSGPESALPVDKSNQAGGKGDTAVGGKAFAETLSGAKPTNAIGPQGVAKAAPAGTIPVTDVATDLQAGKLTTQAAMDRIIERVVAKQVGADAPAAVREQVRSALETALADDPLLASKLKHLES